MAWLLGIRRRAAVSFSVLTVASSRVNVTFTILQYYHIAILPYYPNDLGPRLNSLEVEGWGLWLRVRKELMRRYPCTRVRRSRSSSGRLNACPTSRTVLSDDAGPFAGIRF